MLEPGQYAPSPDDQLWLLRAVEGEGAPRNVVAQTLINRFMWLRATKPKAYPTLAQFVQAYSRPVNPRWTFGGDLYEAAHKAASSAERSRLEAVARKIEGHRSNATFGRSTRDAVRRAFTRGPVDLPTPDTTDFGAPFRQVSEHLVRITPERERRNTFYRARAAQGWQGYGVRIARELQPVAFAASGTLLGVLLVVYLVGKGGARATKRA